MQFNRPHFRISYLCLICAPSVALFSLCGCGSSPSQANIELRKENQTLTDQVSDLKTQNAGLEAQINALQAKWPTTQVLPESRLDQLFTAHGLAFASGTGFVSAEQSDIGKRTLSVYVYPTDDDGQALKAAGSFTFELFDLSLPKDNLLETWDYPLEKARSCWFGTAFLYTYAFNCPLEVTPAHTDLVVQATFVDALTGRRFISRKDVKYDLASPPSTSPTAER
jgi:hypothetical protein